MNKNFFEITNATFKVGGINKVNNVSFSIKDEGDIVCVLVPLWADFQKLIGLVGMGG